MLPKRSLQFAAALLLEEMEEELERPRRKVWVRNFWFRGQWNPYFEKLMMDLAQEGEDFHKRFAHITQSSFEEICEKVGPTVKKQDTFMRKAISVEERVALTLKYLACGDSTSTLSQLFQISPQSICNIVPEVCEAVCTCLKDEYLKTPSTEEEWLRIAKGFELIWNFPNAFGAIDGKHVLCQAPSQSGSAYYNYKGTFSIVLLAVVDSEYKFLYINVGAKGSASDGGIFNSCPLSFAIMNNTLNIPSNRPLPGRTLPIPYCLLADDAFSASERIVKPISGQNLSRIDRVYNYRVSRARRVVKNAFGICSSRWRVLRTKIEYAPKNTQKIVAAACLLHNFCLREKCYLPQNSDLLDRDKNGVITRGTWNDGDNMLDLQPVYSRVTPTTEAIREEYRQYFMSNFGELSWQYNQLS